MLHGGGVTQAGPEMEGVRKWHMPQAEHSLGDREEAEIWLKGQMGEGREDVLGEGCGGRAHPKI